MKRIAARFDIDDQVRSSLARELAPIARPDIDGDRIADAIYAYAPGAVPLTLVYVTRPDCGHLVVETSGRVEVLGSRTHGWADLRVVDDGAAEVISPAAPPRVTALKFDGSRYVAVR